MSVVTKNGKYIARILSLGLEEKGTGSVQAGVHFKCDSFLNGPIEEPCNGEEITSYFNLITTRGALNDINIRGLKESLGWDGSSFESLQNSDWSQTPVQIVVDDEANQQGQMFKRVKYINPRDYQGGGEVKQADTSVIQSLESRYGGLLRATATKNGKNPTPPIAAGQSMGKELAWAAFGSKVDEYGRTNPEDAYTSERRTAIFKEIVTEIAKGLGKDTKTLNPADWVKVKNEIELDFSPAVKGLIPL